MREGWYVIRCVFERPECGPIDPPVLSDPSQAFQMAGFFDPEAPARPIRIALPLDTSPGGLRKFDKNTAFMISDMLCGQINRMKGLTLGDLVLSVLPWPFHKDLPVDDGGPCTRRRWPGNRDDVLAVDSDHHDLRAAALDDHRLSTRLHLSLDSVFHLLFSVAEIQR